MYAYHNLTRFVPREVGAVMPTLLRTAAQDDCYLQWVTDLLKLSVTLMTEVRLRQDHLRAMTTSLSMTTSLKMT